MGGETFRDGSAADVRPGRAAAGAGRPREAARLAAAACAAAARRPLMGRRLGVVLGTGLGGLADRLDRAWSIAAADTGWLPPQTALGHAGRLVWGRIGGGDAATAAGPQPIDVLMLQGRAHGYEGLPVESLERGVELLAALGAVAILLTNAAGGLRPDMRVGELVVVRDHIDLFRRRYGTGRGACDQARGGGDRPPCSRSYYEPVLVDAALAATRAAGVPARAGVYAHLTGPSYETRAEYRMLRRIGADVVGMSTVPEAVVAHRLGVRVAAVSVVTNVARPDAADRTDAEDVCRVSAAAGAGVWAILEGVACDVMAGGEKNR